ncbi:MAG: FMN-binding protein, partial [Clostridia bacterium]|nr:FMN-binding protein [Clostridia bacterium]
MKKDAIKSIVVLSSICLIVALLLSTLNVITAPIIAQSEAAKENSAYLEVLPEAATLEEVTLGDDVPPSVLAMMKDSGGSGYAFKLLATATYSGTPMTVIVGIGTDGKITKMSFVEYTDSPGIGTPEGFDELFRGKDNTTTDNDAGATVTTNAIKAVLNDAYAVLGKYSDLEQSDEQKLVNLYGKLMPWAANPSSGASKFEAVDISQFDGVNPAVSAVFAPSTKVGYVVLVKNGDGNVAAAVNAFGKAYMVLDLD